MFLNIPTELCNHLHNTLLAFYIIQKKSLFIISHSPFPPRQACLITFLRETNRKDLFTVSETRAWHLVSTGPYSAGCRTMQALCLCQIQACSCLTQHLSSSAGSLLLPCPLTLFAPCKASCHWVQGPSGSSSLVLKSLTVALRTLSPKRSYSWTPEHKPWPYLFVMRGYQSA